MDDMRISVTELKTNLGKFLERATVEDIIITRYGKDIALLTNVENEKRDAPKSLRGILKGADITREEIRKERLARYNEDSN